MSSVQTSMWNRSLTQPDLKMINQHDFQSICQLALSQLNVKPTTPSAPNFLFSGLNQQSQQQLTAAAPEETHPTSLPAPPPSLVISPASTSSPTATSVIDASSGICNRAEHAADGGRGVEFDQLVSTPSPVPRPISRPVKEKGQTEKACTAMTRIPPTGSPPKPARIVHLLRCPICSLESINKVRFDAHLPCSRNIPENNYLLYSCSLCLACSTSHFLVEEHLELFHPGCSAEVIRTEERFGSHSVHPAPSSRNSTPSTLSPTSPINVPSNLSSPLQTATKTPQFPLQVSTGRSESTEPSGNCLSESEEGRLMEPNNKTDTQTDLLDILLSAKKTNENETIFAQDTGQTESLDLSRIPVSSKDSEHSTKSEFPNPFEPVDQKGRELLSFMTALAASGSLFGRPAAPGPLLPGSSLLDETAFMCGLGQDMVERPNSSTAPPAPAQRKCHICSEEIPDLMPEYMKHLTMTHLMPAPMALITSLTVYKGVGGLESSAGIPKLLPQAAVSKGDFSCITSSALSSLMPVPQSLLNPDAISRVGAGCDLSNLLNNAPFAVPMPGFWPNFNISGDQPRGPFDQKSKDKTREPQPVGSFPANSMDSLKACISTDPLSSLDQRRIPAFPLGVKSMFGLGFNSLCEHLPASLRPRQSPETAFPLQPPTSIHSAGGLPEASGDRTAGRNWDETAMGPDHELSFKRPRLETSGLDPFLNANQLSSPSGSVLPPPFSPGFMYRPPSSLLERETAAGPTNPSFLKSSAKTSRTSLHSDQSSSISATHGSTTISPTSSSTNNARRNTSGMQEEGGSGQPTAIVHNTLRKTKSDMKVIHRYFVQVKNDNREIHEMPPEDLSSYIQDFILTAKKKDGHEYEPESLKAFVHSLERHLKYHNYPHSVLKDPAFASARLVLSQRLNELRALSQANSGSAVHSGRSAAHGRNSTSAADDCSPYKAAFLSEKCRSGSGDGGGFGGGKLMKSHLLMQNGLLGFSNPQAILNSIWLIVRTQLNIVGTQKHRNLTWGQFQLVTNANSQELLRFTSRSNPPEVRYCQGHGGPMSGRPFSTSSSSGLTGSTTGRRQPLPFNCVEAFHYYIRLRPLDCSGPDDPLYLCPDPAWERGGPWFRSTAAGAQLLSRIPRLLGLKPARDYSQPPKRLEPEMQLAVRPDGTNETESPLLPGHFLSSNLVSSYRSAATPPNIVTVTKASLMPDYGENGLTLPPIGRTYSTPLKLTNSESDEHHHQPAAAVAAATVSTPAFTISSFGPEREDRFPLPTFSTQNALFPPPNFGSLSLFAAAAAAAAAAATSVTKMEAPALSPVESIPAEGRSIPALASRRTPVREPAKSPCDYPMQPDGPEEQADPAVATSSSSPMDPAAASTKGQSTSPEDNGTGVDLRLKPTTSPSSFMLASPP